MIEAKPSAADGGLRYDPVRLLILQPTPFCNLDCDYCYLPNKSRHNQMSREILEKALDVVFNTGLVGNRLTLVWHSGEPLVMPKSFYDAASLLINKRASNTVVTQSLQTNATLVDDEWCDVFKRNGIKIGVSLDGPADLHDKHRIDRQKRGSFRHVMRGIETLQRNAVPFHIITVVTAEALDRAEEMVEFFVECGIEQVGFNFEEVEAANESSSISSIDLVRIKRFWQRVYDKNNSLGQPLRIREFARALAAISNPVVAQRTRMGNDQARPFGIISIGSSGQISTFSPELLEATSKDFASFVFGNVVDGELVSMLKNPHFRRVAREIAEGVKLCSERCAYFDYCGGGAPVNKLFENGSFASTETLYCKSAIQAPIDILLDDLEARLVSREGPA